MTANRFQIFWSWTPRVETPEQIHDRMAKSIEALSAINSAFASWKVMDFAQGLQSLLGGKLGLLGRMLAPKNAAMGEPAPPAGFMVLAAKDFGAWPSGMALLCAGAGQMTLPGMCGVTFKTEDTESSDPELISYSTLKSIMMALVPVWEASYAQASSSLLKEQFESDGRFYMFNPSWMTYLSPALAGKIDPPKNVVVEDMSDRGLLLIAAEEPFDTNNPEHMAGARSLQAALAPLNRAMS